MKTLVIDSLGRKINENENTLHTRNAKIIARELGADICGSINPPLEKYDKIIFVHASPASDVKSFDEFFKINKDSDIFYIKNEWNLGEPVPYWAMYRDYKTPMTVIANHSKAQPYGSRFDKYFDHKNGWHVLNLNSLIFNEFKIDGDNDCGFFEFSKNKIVYYGSQRNDRTVYFKKYLDRRMFVSTSENNVNFFKKINPDIKFIKKLNWYGSKNTLADFEYCLYLEDVYTHTNYNYLANRFYESLTAGIPCFFDSSCLKTIRLSGYVINEWYVVDSADELWQKIETDNKPEYNLNLLIEEAIAEKQKTILGLKEIINR